MKRKFAVFREMFRGNTIYKMVFIMLLFLLPIDIMAIFMMNEANKKQVEMAETNILNVIDSQAKRLEDDITMVEREAIYICFNGGELSKISGIDESYSNAEIARLLTGAKQEVERIKRGYSNVDILYFDFPENGYFISDGTLGISADKYIEEIRSLEADRENRFGDVWQTKMLENKAILENNTSWRGMNYGVMLNLDFESRKVDDSGIGGVETTFFANEDESIISASGRRFLEDKDCGLDSIRSNPNYRVYETEVSEYGIKLMTVVDSTSVTGSIPVMIRILQIVLILLIGTGIPYTTWYFKKKVINPVNSLVKAMGEVEKGNIDYRTHKEKSDTREFELLKDSFNSMIEEVQHLKIDVYERELEKQDIKMHYLSQQIQPHFILNALNILYSYEPDEFEQSQKMIMCISKYFRYIVYANAQFVTLDAELDHIKNYFEIQKARFPELFFSIVECAPEVEKAAIPPLMLQTLVENSIKNSMKIGNKITIFVIADLVDIDEEEVQDDSSLAETEGESYIRNDKSKLLRIRIADTGQGISDEIISQIEEFQKTGKPQKNLGIGIQNTIERLNLLYAEGYYKPTIKFSRAEEKGTNIELRMPFYKEDFS